MRRAWGTFGDQRPRCSLRRTERTRAVGSVRRRRSPRRSLRVLNDSGPPRGHSDTMSGAGRARKGPRGQNREGTLEPALAPDLATRLPRRPPASRSRPLTDRRAQGLHHRRRTPPGGVAPHPTPLPRTPGPVQRRLLDGLGLIRSAEQPLTQADRPPGAGTGVWLPRVPFTTVKGASTLRSGTSKSSTADPYASGNGSATPAVAKSVLPPTVSAHSMP